MKHHDPAHHRAMARKARAKGNLALAKHHMEEAREAEIKQKKGR